jgi:hypothetical protein
MLFPIPFQYYHIVNVTLMINLLLLSYAFLSINSVFSIPGNGLIFCPCASHSSTHIAAYASMHTQITLS